MYTYSFEHFYQLQKFTSYLFQQGHLSKRTTRSRHAIHFTSELCEILYQFTDQRNRYAYSWKRPAVISCVERGLQKSRGPIVGLCFGIQDKIIAGKWARKLGCGESLFAFLLGVYSLHKFKVGKRKEKKGKLHSYLLWKK